MKKHSFLTAGLISAALLQAAPAAIDVSGTMTYSQNFDGLPTGPGLAEFDWTDDVTVPGFYLHRTNARATETTLAGTRNTPGARPYISDGSVAANGTPNFHGFLSLGTYGDTDRALGACPTTTDSTTTNWSGGSLSVVSLFTNTSTRSVDLVDIYYELESWRGNSSAANSETITLTYKVGNASALLAELGAFTASGTFGIAGYQPVNGSSFDFTSFDGFAAIGTTERSGSLTPPIRIGPGQSVVLRWGNTNDGGTDAQVGIDNLSLNFTEVTASVAPTVTNVVRNDNLTPTNPLDDTVSFDLAVAGLGAVNPAGWSVTSPAALSTLTGLYSPPASAVSVTSIPILEFAAGTHTLDITVADQGNPGTNATVTVTAPWCTMTATATNLTRDSGGNSDPSDDTWGYTVTVTGQYTGAEWTSTNNLYSSGTYGTPIVVTGIPISSPTDTATIFDSSDPACSTTVTASPPRIIGAKNFGVEQPLFSSNEGVPSQWVVDEFLRTQNMTNGGGVPARVYRSEVIDVSAIGEVLFTGELSVTDLTSGFEVADSFNAQLIVDGNTAAPISLITPYDTLTADGVLNGAEISPATAGPPPTSGPGNWIHLLNAVIPASANSVQLVISGNNDSANEIMQVQNLLFQLAPHSIQAQLAGASVFHNNNTVDPTDDSFTQGLNITSVSAPVTSTGWTSDSTPAAGLYTDSNPVVFGPFSALVPPASITITDNSVGTVTATVPLNMPVPDLVSSLVEGSALRLDNGTADNAADDTITVQFNVSAPVGGPSLLVASYPSSATVSPATLTAASQVVTVTLSNVPEDGTLALTLSDASYAASFDRYVITVPPAVVTQYVVAQKNLGGGLSNVVTDAATAPPVEWTNYPSIPALQMNNGGALAAVTSEVIDLSTAGEVAFTANLRITDTSTGFEETDTFKAELIIDGNAAAPVSLIAALDTNLDGILSGTELAPTPNGEFNYPLSATIDAAATSVQLVVTAINNSASEWLLFENALFLASGPPPIVPGNGSLAVNIGSSGKLRATALTGLASGGAGALSISGVQSGPTPRGGNVSLQDGWIIYESPAGYSGVDTFTYSITDGTQSVTGSVTVLIAPAAGQTQNLIGLVPAGDGMQVGGMGIPGRTYVWEYSGDLTTWTALGAPAVCPANGVMGVLDPGPLPQSRFYRLVEVGQAP